MKLIRIFIIVAVSLILNYSEYKESEGSNNRLPEFQELKNNYYIIRYTNIIIDISGKKVKIPIYNGMYGDIELEQLNKKQTDKKGNILGNMIIPIKKGHATETFKNILAFYQKKMNIHEPTLLDRAESGITYIWFDFSFEGLPSCMMIMVEVDESATDDNAVVNMLKLKEDAEYIGISIIIGVSCKDV